ncbi:MAG: sigma-70 family RNA polymerase sigma factor [Gammaproteobacteria bacterium]|nr:sigma-70 family RNA polymerase sigma factor [Gammaproteobacteria bacterium]
MSDTSDEKLMTRYRNGDTAAFDSLYGRHCGPIFRYVERQCRNHAVAEELYQDIWMRVIRARKQWQPGTRFQPWLYRIAHNRIIDHWRAGRESHARIEDEAIIPLDQPWPDAVMLIRECVERLFKLLAGLSEPQRSAFLLKEEAGLSLEQIAEVTGTGYETVKSRLRYALRRLRAGLEGCDE